MARTEKKRGYDKLRSTSGVMPSLYEVKFINSGFNYTFLAGVTIPFVEAAELRFIASSLKNPIIIL